MSRRPKGAMDRPQLLRDGIVASIGSYVRDLQVEVLDSGVILSGRAPSYHVKQLAQEAVLRIKQSGCVDNRITVDTRPNGSQAGGIRETEGS